MSDTIILTVPMPRETAAAFKELAKSRGMSMRGFHAALINAALAGDIQVESKVTVG